MQSPKFDRLSETEATTAATRLLGFYPSMNASDPGAFLMGLVEMFLSYTPPTVMRSISPIRGLPAKFKFMPSLAEVRETLEAYEEEELRHTRLSRFTRAPAALSAPRPAPRPPGASYEEMVAKHGRPIGRFEKGTKWERLAGSRSGSSALAGRNKDLEAIAAAARARAQKGTAVNAPANSPSRPDL